MANSDHLVALPIAEQTNETVSGLTKLEYFAAKIMAALVSNSNKDMVGMTYAQSAQDSVLAAKLLITELNK